MDGGRPTISSTNKGPILGITACICLPCCIVLALLAIWKRRQNKTKLRMFGQDVSLLVLLGPLVAQTAVLLIQVFNGLGETKSKLSSVELLRFEKLEYANELFFVLLITLSKALTWMTVRSVSPVALVCKIATIIGVTTVVVMSAFFLATIFQCQSPFWNIRSGQCFDKYAFWIAFGCADVASEVAALAFVLYFVMSVQMQFGKRFRCIAVACTRFGTIAAAVSRMVLARRAFSSADYTLEAFPFSFATQVEIYMIVFVWSVNSFLIIIEGLNTGYLSSAFTNRVESRKDSHVELESGSGQKSFGGSRTRSGRRSSGASSVRPLNAFDPVYGNAHTGSAGHDASSTEEAKDDRGIVITRQVDVVNY